MKPRLKYFPYMLYIDGLKSFWTAGEVTLVLETYLIGDMLLHTDQYFGHFKSSEMDACSIINKENGLSINDRPFQCDPMIVST